MTSPYGIAVGVAIDTKANQILYHGNTSRSTKNSEMKRAGIGDVCTMGTEKIKYLMGGQARCSLEIGTGVWNRSFLPAI
jgi:hypothetical protein